MRIHSFISLSGVMLIMAMITMEVRSFPASYSQSAEGLAPPRKGVETCTAAPLLCPTTRDAVHVCGTDGVTYINRSCLRCAANKGKNVELDYPGRCRPPVLPA